MADKKISQLTGATTPLAGTEVLPIVQGGNTVKVSVANLTAGRDVSANMLTAADNVVIGTVGKGITTGSATPLKLGTNNTVNAVTIDTSGNLGVNTAPSGWFDGFTAVQIPAGSFSGYFANTLIIRQNSFFSAATSDTRYVNNGFAEEYALVGGEHIWSSAPSGIAGNAATFTQYMKLDASGNLTVNAGNLVLGTNGKGIDFSANTHAPGMTSELLNWYEEGTWTPSVGGDATYSGRTGYYTRIGRQVTITCDMSIDVLGTGSPKYVTGMPYQSIAFSAGSMSYFAGLLSNVVHIAPQVTPFNSVSFATLASAGASVTDDTSIFANGTRVIFTITYFV